MKLKDLEYLVAIDDCRSLSAASERLYVTQSALSKYLGQLEDQIGTPLFLRSNKKLVPTEAGKIYASFARKSLNEFEKVEKICHNASKIQTMTIGVPSNIIPSLQDTLIEFSKTYPSIHLTLYEERFSQIQKSLENGEIDIAFSDKPDQRFGIESRHVFYEEVFLIKPKSLNLPYTVDKDGFRHLDIHLLNNQKFLYPGENEAFNNQIIQIMSTLDFEPKEITSLNSHYSLTYMVMKGYGAGFTPVPENYIEDRKETLPLYRFTDEPVIINCYANYRKDSPLKGKIKDFISILDEHIHKKTR